MKERGKERKRKWRESGEGKERVIEEVTKEGVRENEVKKMSVEIEGRLPKA